MDDYLSWMNKTYGSLLPKGWVFRLPTVAEAQLSRVRFGNESYWTDEAKLKPLHKHGLFTEFSSLHEIFTHGGRTGEKIPVNAVLTGAVRGKKANRVYPSSFGELCLDSISTPDMPPMNGWAPQAGKYLEPVLACKKTMTDPFWYCPPDASDRRHPTAGGAWCLRTDTFSGRHPVMIRLVVGYDYVGEWKAKNGK